MADQDDQIDDTDDDMIETGDGSDDTSSDKDGKPAEWTAPTKEEWDRTQAALKKANEEAKRHRLKARELAKDTDAADDGKAQKAAEDAEKRFKPVAIRSAAKAALLEAGLNDASPSQLKRLVGMLDMADIDVDDDGEVDGLDEQISDIKTDFPMLFKTAERKRTGRLDAANRDSGGKIVPKTTGEKHAAALFGR